MEELINKLKEFTQDGPPGVGQRIELSDIAKKVGVKRVELEKLINEFIAKKSVEEPVQESIVEEAESDSTKEKQTTDNPFERPLEDRFRQPDFERPDLDTARDSFEKELNLRQQNEREKLDASIPEFQQPDIVFPELNVSFGNTEEVKPEIESEIDTPKIEDIEMPEIIQEELKSAFVVPEIPVSHIEVKTDDFPPLQENATAINEPSISFEPEIKQPQNFQQEEEEADFSFTENGAEIPTFEQNIKNSQEKLDQEDILRKIIAKNKE
jgi:hypothetical protein